MSNCLPDSFRLRHYSPSVHVSLRLSDPEAVNTRPIIRAIQLQDQQLVHLDLFLLHVTFEHRSISTRQVCHYCFPFYSCDDLFAMGQAATYTEVVSHIKLLFPSL